jgi:hypothetical protein
MLEKFEESDFGDSLIFIITNNTIIFENNIESYIELSNKKLLSINIFIYKSTYLSKYLKKFIDSTNTIINIINDDPYDYLRYISFLTNKQIISYNLVSRIYDFNINSNLSKNYQLISASNFILYDRYGNQRSFIKTNYTDTLFKYDFVALSGRNILIFNNDTNRFAILKNYNIDDGLMYIDNNTIFINTNKNISFNYSIYTNSNSNSNKITYKITESSMFHKINLNFTNTPQTFVVNIDWDLINMNMFENIFNYGNINNNLINNLPISNIVNNIINDNFNPTNIINNLESSDFFRKLSICDLRFYPYCIALIVWSSIFVIIIICIYISTLSYVYSRIACINIYLYNMTKITKKYKIFLRISLIIICIILLFIIIFFNMAIHVSIPHVGFKVDIFIVSFVIFIIPLGFIICILYIYKCIIDSDNPTPVSRYY